MEVNAWPHRSKLELLLDKLLEGKSHSRLDECLRKLVIRLSCEDAPEVTLTFPIFGKWIVRAVTSWSGTRIANATSIISFVLNLAEILSRNETRFNKLNKANFFITLINLAKVETTSSVKLAHIKMLSSILEHNSGIECMMACNFWEDIFQMYLTSSDVQIIRESISFIGKILEKTVKCDEHFCDNLIKKIMLPLGENIHKCVKASVDVSDEVADLHLKPSLKLLVNILETSLKGICFEGKDLGVVLIFYKNFHLEERVCELMIVAHKPCLVFDLSKIMFMMQFIDLYLKTITNTITLPKIDLSVNRIKTNFILNMYRGTFMDQIEFMKFGVFYWRMIESRIPSLEMSKSVTDRIYFSDRLVIFMSMTNMYVLTRYFLTLVDFEEEFQSDDFRSDFFRKFKKNFSYEFMRVVYFWRKYMVEIPDIVKICERTLNVLKGLHHYLSRQQGVLSFRIFIYFLKDFIRSAMKCPEKLHFFLQESQNGCSYIIQIFEYVGILIEDFQIVLKDGIEATYVMDFCFDFLTLTDWSSDVVVQVMKLVNIAVAHYMAPNMALLVENAGDATMTLLGPFLYSRLYDKDCEVMRAALEVICTAAHISNKKFPSLQKVLMDSELPTLVVKMSTCDGESFVRATAIKCLQEMIQVEEIWNNALKTEDLSQKMRDILLNETEGIVRVEAATFMCVAYEHHQFPRDALDAVYETMIYSSTTDLHWEVKVRALAFWDQVIKNHLQNQGMIDGTFPNVTFSKEHRKIVTLTDSEIRKRLFKVLKQLSAIGCLGVLTCAIKDDCDMEVSKTAVKIAQVLVDLFKKYNVRSDSSAPTSPTPTENGHSGMSMSSGISVDESMDSPASGHPADLNEEIIEQIVNAKDAQLLKNVYAPSDYGSVSNYDIQVRKIVSPNEFLQFTQQDLNGIINEKKKWLNGIEDLGSLLDDMLKTYDDDVNNMDCY